MHVGVKECVKFYLMSTWGADARGCGWLAGGRAGPLPWKTQWGTNRRGPAGRTQRRRSSWLEWRQIISFPSILFGTGGPIISNVATCWRVMLQLNLILLMTSFSCGVQREGVLSTGMTYVSFFPRLLQSTCQLNASQRQEGALLTVFTTARRP